MNEQEQPQNKLIKTFSGSAYFSNFVTTLLVGLLIASSFAIGSLWTKVKYLEGGSANNAANGNPNVLGAGNGNKPAQDPTVPQKNDNLVKPNDKDHYIGDKNAKVAFIEYSDFECPFCKRFEPTVQQMLKEYGNKILYIHRHFPLSSIHPSAQKMAEASECVAKLGGEDKFWAFAQKLYADAEDKIKVADLAKTAASVGVDANAVQKCLDSGEMAGAVDEQYQGGLKAGINGTPGSFVLNQKTGMVLEIKGAYPYADVKTAIDKLLN
jgi:protein-disulfide isomerase